jgi:hypothetical protein
VYLRGMERVRKEKKEKKKRIEKRRFTCAAHKT